MRDELLAIEQFDRLLEAKYLSPTGETTTTHTAHTPRSVCSHQPNTQTNGQKPTRKNSHNEWTKKRGPVTPTTTQQKTKTRTLPKPGTDQKGSTMWKSCRECKERVFPGTKVCPHCGATKPTATQIESRIKSTANVMYGAANVVAGAGCLVVTLILFITFIVIFISFM